MTQQGMSTRASPLVSELLAQDSHTLAPGLQMVGNHVPQTKAIPFSRYTDPAFARLEMERLWSRNWQMACRTEDIPQVGDRLPYDVGTDLSLIIVRSGPHEFKAFHNACRHRGTRLVNAPGAGAAIRCPFHGWQWKLDGALDSVPLQWDFGGVSAASHSLDEVKLAVWEGYIFINPDPNAGAFEPTLGALPQLFGGGRGHGDRYTFAYVSKKIRANWKTVMEAFLEAYHVIETHTDSMPFVGDANTSYDIWESGAGHVSRLITPSAVPSPHLGDDASTQVAAEGFAMFVTPPGVPAPKFDTSKGGNARAPLAEWRRGLMGQALGRDFSQFCDAELIDSIQYHLFPNFCPWFGDGVPLVYQFLPYGDNPNESVLNVRLLAPIPANGVRPPSAAARPLDFDDYFSDKAPEFGALAHIFDQDLANLPMVQRGMHSAKPQSSHQTLGRYMEQRIQYFHNVLGQVLGVE